MHDPTSDDKSDVGALARRYVDVWNEADSGRRRQMIRDLWAVDGTECTKTRVTRGREDLEARITASHEKNVRDGGNRFLLRGADRNNEVVKLDWKMIRVRDGLVKATGSYVLRLNEHDRIAAAYFFLDP